MKHYQKKKDENEEEMRKNLSFYSSLFFFRILAQHLTQEGDEKFFLPLHF